MPSRVARATLDILRSCGSGRRECIVYWTALEGSDSVARVVHPRHAATWGSVEVDGAWATEFFLDLPERGERTVAQVHIHPGSRVAHSATDDDHVLVPVPGFVSIVLPDFGLRELLDGSGIWELARDGSWRAAAEEIEWEID